MISSIGAMIGPLSSGDANYSARRSSTWAVWWLADAAGIVIIVPFIVLWATTPLRPVCRIEGAWKQVIIAAASAISVIALSP